MRVLLPPEQIEIQPIEVTNENAKLHAKHKEAKAENHEEDEPQAKKPYAKPQAKRANEEEINEPETEHERPHVAESLTEPQPAEDSVEDEGVPAASPEEKVSKDLPTLPDRVKKSNRADVLFTEIREYLADPKTHDRPAVYLRGSIATNGLLYKENKLWVADDLRLDVIREIHDQPAVGHTGVKKTMLTIQQHYFWPKMKKDVDRYI